MGSSSRFARFVLVLSCLAVLAGCAGGQRSLQDGPEMLVFAEDDIRFMRPTLTTEPRRCHIKQLYKERYVNPPSRTFWQWLTGQEPDTHFWTCPASKRALQLDTWEPLSVRWDDSLASKALPALIHGAGFAGGMLGAAVLWPESQVVQQNIENESNSTQFKNPTVHNFYR